MEATTLDTPRSGTGWVAELYLGRLRRFLVQAADETLPAPWLRLARRGAATAYRDCVLLGLRVQAEVVLAEVRLAEHPARGGVEAPKRIGS